METVTLAEQRRFSDESLQKIPVFDSTFVMVDQYCLKPGQSQRIHAHEAQDKIYTVLTGEALVTVGEEQELLPEGSSVIARAGVPHGVSNESDSNVVLLVIMAPKQA